MIIEKTEYVNDTLLGCLEWLVANERIKGYKLDKVIEPVNSETLNSHFANPIKELSYNKLTITLNDDTSFTIRTDLWTGPLGTFLR
jgi:nitrogen fixation protein FixH